MLSRGVGDFVWTSASGQGEVCGSCENFSGRKRRAERRIRRLRARGPTELIQVACGSVMQGLGGRAWEMES